MVGAGQIQITSLEAAFESHEHPFAMEALNHLFAFTATYFCSWAKVGKTAGLNFLGVAKFRSRA
ncbi:hypothetical protein C4Q28_14560 [Pseudomonas sp. SWI6]|nr:hypothetical protein C4Q28_14560 [Pseudomonas sp. SWI6]